MERHRNWIQLKVFLSLMSLMTFCAVWSYFSIIEAKSKTSEARSLVTGISQVAGKSSLVAIIQNEGIDVTESPRRNRISDGNSDTSGKTESSIEENKKVVPDVPDRGTLVTDAKCRSRACRSGKPTTKKASMTETLRSLRDGQSSLEDRTLPSQSVRNVNDKGKPTSGNAVMQLKNRNGKFSGNFSSRPTLRLRKIAARAKRDAARSSAVEESPSRSSPNEKAISDDLDKPSAGMGEVLASPSHSSPNEKAISDDLDKPSAGMGEVLPTKKSEIQKPSHNDEGLSTSMLSSTVKPDKRPSAENQPTSTLLNDLLRTNKPPEASAVRRKPTPLRSASSSSSDNSRKTHTSPPNQSSGGQPESTGTLASSQQPTLLVSEAPTPTPSSLTDSFPGAVPDQDIPVHASSQPSNEATAYLSTNQVHHQSAPPPISTASLPTSPSVTPTPNVKPQTQSVTNAKFHGDTKLRTAPSLTTALPAHDDGSGPWPITTTNGSGIQDVKERTSGSECASGDCDASSRSPNRPTDDSYWALGSLMSILLLLTACVLYTGLWKKRNHMSNPMSDVSCHVQAQASPSHRAKIDIKELLIQKLSHIKSLNNSPFGKRRRNGSSSSNGRYLHRYDRLPLLVRGEEDDEEEEEEEEEFSREWGPTSKEHTVSVYM